MNDSREPLFRHPQGQQSVWSTVNNFSGGRGRAGLDGTNLHLAAGEKQVLCEFDGPGIIDRIWLTFNWPGKAAHPESMLRNRSVYIECYWDGASTPAVRAPLSDFFCRPLGYDIPFENALFADPAGRSFLSYIPMPFRRHARIEIHNGFHSHVHVYRTVSMRKGVEIAPEDGYLHACWRRSAPAAGGEDHEILPRIQGRGRYLGTHFGILSNPGTPMIWNESQIRFYLEEDDDEHPSMMVPSLDDYIGSSWDYDMLFMHQDSGLLLSRYFPAGGGHHSLYNYHRRDPLYFDESCRMTLRPIYGATAGRILQTVKNNPGLTEQVALLFDIEELRERVRAGDNDLIQTGQSDDISSVALFYLDRPEGGHTSEKDLATRCLPGWNWPTDSGWMDRAEE